MARIRVSVLGPVQVEVDGSVAKLSPRALRVLMRLVAAGGRPVGVKQLRWDLWREVDRPHESRNGRNQVQKGISELRGVFDPARSGAADEVLRTEEVYSGPERQSAYRLVLGPDNLDAAEFGSLVGEAMHGAVAAAADRLTQAVALWRGRPLAQAGDEAYAENLVRIWREQYATALRELVRIHGEFGRFDLALPFAKRLAEEFPEDAGATAGLSEVRERLRERHGDELLRRAFPELRTEVALVRGDLFAQKDASLVVGFTDTFDVETRESRVISRQSVQGQLVDRLYGGDTAALDRELRRGLRAVPSLGLETRSAKPRGKLLRYPVGTVIPVPYEGRLVYAAAYSRLDNDLVAKSSREDLAATLDRVWESAARYGRMLPIAVPLLGSGLARITELRQEQLLRMIVESFLRGCRRYHTVAPQLRIVLRPEDLQRIDPVRVAKEILAL
ncbi:MAG TPA: macro domain-containing protein [Actinospica sp.]|nr:macro domain-containing protein [Actinospica sp.]